MTDYGCKPACAGCRKKGSCDTPRTVPVVQEEDMDTVYPFLPTPRIRSVKAPDVAGRTHLVCGCTIPEILIVLIGSNGQQVYCFEHKQYSRISAAEIKKAKKKASSAVAVGQGTFDDCPF